VHSSSEAADFITEIINEKQTKGDFAGFTKLFALEEILIESNLGRQEGENHENR